jgi:excisionase family DNA binding protein
MIAREIAMSKSNAEPERLLTLSELALYLQLSQKTVLKLAHSKDIPGKLIDKEWRFKRSAVDQWLTKQSDLGESFEDIPDGMRLPLGELLPDEAIVHDMRARDPLSAIEELAARAYGLRFLKDKPWFVGALVEREALASTAMEGGVAFLHTRSRDTERVNRPFVIVGRSYDGVQFGAPDGKPTYLFFLLGLKYDKLHLPILGRLARIMTRHPQAVTKLRASTSAGKMRMTLLNLDAEALDGFAPAPAVSPRSAELDKKARLRQIMRVNAQKQYDAKKADVADRAIKKKAGALEAGRASRAAAKLAAASAPPGTAKPARKPTKAKRE